MSVGQHAFEQALVERYKPRLVLYPEISTEQRANRENWREADLAPLLADYYPRDVSLALDHARVRSGRAATHTVHEGPRVMDAMATNACDRIDIIDGAGHADRDRFWAEYYRIAGKLPPHERDAAYPVRAYAHVAYGRDLDAPPAQYAPLIAIEYWLFYLYNDWKATHEGDWELAIVLLRQPRDASLAPEPIACAYSAHHGGFRLRWDRVQKVDDAGRHGESGGTHPLVYVANGSHANYFFGPGKYHTTTSRFGLRVTGGEFPFTGSFVDYTTSLSDGTALFPDVVLLSTPSNGHWQGDLRWLNFTGEWGSSGVPRWLAPVLRVVPKRYSFSLKRKVWGAPESIVPRRNWSDPFSWVDNECEEAPIVGSWLALQS